MFMGFDDGTVDLYSFHIRILYQGLKYGIDDTLIKPTIVTVLYGSGICLAFWNITPPCT